MKSEKNILIAFVLNLSFSIFEILGGLLTNSISIISDAIHDFADSISIILSYFFEKKSKNKPDNQYTYGYVRYSVLGAFITSSILTLGSILVIYNSILRLINPVSINYDGMIILAIIGVIVNFFAAYFTKEGYSLNEKSVNLHMLEDVLGWVIVLVGSILMKFTNISIIDSIMSLMLSLYILIHAFKNLKLVLDLFLEKTPSNISIDDLKKIIMDIKGVINVHHIHLWSIDGFNNYATMHVVTNSNNIKHLIKDELLKHGIIHVTIEIEKEDEVCDDDSCVVNNYKHHH